MTDGKPPRTGAVPERTILRASWSFATLVAHLPPEDHDGCRESIPSELGPRLPLPGTRGPPSSRPELSGLPSGPRLADDGRFAAGDHHSPGERNVGPISNGSRRSSASSKIFPRLSAATPPPKRRTKEYQRVEGLLGRLYPLRSKVMTTVELAFVGVPAAAIETFIAGDERLGQVQFALEEAGRNATFRLPREQEQLLSSTASMAWRRGRG